MLISCTPACERDPRDAVGSGVALAASSTNESVASSTEPAPAACFQGRMRPLAPWVAELRKRVDPAADGWPSEVLARAVETRLTTALEALLARGDHAPFEALIADAFEGATSFVPAELERVADDGALAIELGVGLPGTRAPRDDLPRALHAWRARYAALAPTRVAIAVDGVELLDDARARTEALVRVVAGDPSLDGAKGAVRADALRVTATWTRAEKDAKPALIALDVARFESAFAASPSFRGVTRAVFGAAPCFADELWRGNEDYHLRQDRLAGQPLLGMHGIALGDVDGDGLEDLYVSQPGALANRLFLHRPDGTAVDVAREARVDFLDGCGPALLVDLDGDGDLDLAVAAGAHVLLSWNDGKGRFPQGQVLKAPDPSEIMTLTAADPDLDGDLDLFAGRYSAGGMIGAAPTPYHDARNGARNLYWRNDGEHRFSERLSDVGLDAGGPRFTLSAVWHDVDEDGDDDLYVVNDFGENQLFLNEHGRFRDVARERGVLDRAAGMGADLADADGDGRLDLYVTNMHSPVGLRVATQPRFLAAHPELRADYVRHARGNTLLRAGENGSFEDVTERAGVAPAGWGWGARFFDLQNDGRPDLYAPCGFVTNGTNELGGDLSGFFWRCVIARTSMEPPPEPEYLNAWTALRHFTSYEGGSYAGHERQSLFVNLGDLRFVEVAGALGVDFLQDGRVCAPLDWDEDGREDLLLRNRSGPRLRLLRNEHPSRGSWIAFELAGTRSNKDAIGAIVRVVAGGRRFVQAVHAQAGFLCGTTRRLHFGLGDATEVESVEVAWPGGEHERFGAPAPRARWRLVQGAGRAQVVPLHAQPALAKASRDPPGPAMRPVERIPLLDRLPMRSLELPQDARKDARLGDLAGGPALVCVLACGDASSERFVASLAAVKRSLEASNARVACLVRGGAGERGDLRARIDAAGFGAHAGVADARFLDALQVFVIDVLGPFEKLPLPLLLELDPAAQLCAMRCGVLDAACAAKDIEALGRGDPRARGVPELNPGRLIADERRDLASVAQVFDVIGRADLARACRQALEPAQSAQAPR